MSFSSGVDVFGSSDRLLNMSARSIGVENSHDEIYMNRFRGSIEKENLSEVCMVIGDVGHETDQSICFFFSRRRSIIYSSRRMLRRLSRIAKHR